MEINNPYEQIPEEDHEFDHETRPVTDHLQNAAPFQAHQQKRKRTTLVGSVIAAVVVVGLIAFLVLKPKPAPSQQQPTNTPAASIPTTKAIASTTTHYESEQFSLELDHPSDWEVEDNDDKGILTITSPEVSIPSEDGTIAGQITFKVRGGAQKLTEFNDGNATAVIASDKITYKNPSSAQRGQTYISFARFASSIETGIDAIYVTGDFGYKSDQAIPKVDISKIDPIITITFNQCDGACDTPLNVDPLIWKDASVGQHLKKMLESIVAL